MTTPVRAVLAVLCTALVCACTMTPKKDPGFAATRPMPEIHVSENAGAIFQPGQAVALFEDVRARRIGDLLTVVLVESTQASKKANASTKKENSVSLPAVSLLGSQVTFNAPGALPLASNRNNTLGLSVDSKQKFTGGGDTSQENSLSGSITVTVAEVLSNGNMVVRGEKILTLNQGDEHIRIAGIVRPADIRPDNSVLSTQVADAQIVYSGTGQLADSSTSGWLGRFFNSKWWPF